jgi:hypothetical protein
VPHAKFTLEWSAGDGRAAAMAAEASEHGLYAFPRNLAPGEYHLVASGRAESTIVHIERSQSTVEAELRLVGSGSITVETRDDAGHPLEGLHVTAHSTTSPNGVVMGVPVGDGRYRVGPLPAGPYTVVVEDGINPSVARGGAADGPLMIASGSNTTLRIVLPRSGTLRGRVLDPGGHPVSNAWISTRASSIQQRSALLSLLNAPRALTNAAGEFEIPGLARDALYDVEVAPTVGPAARQPAVSLQQEIELQLAAVDSEPSK